MDDLLLTKPYFNSRKYVQSKLITVRKGPKIKCKTPPNPPKQTGKFYYTLNQTMIVLLSLGLLFNLNF